MTGFGVDVAILRADDLDRLLLADIKKEKVVNALDLGCGAGGQSARMVKAGAQVCGVDIYDFSQQVQTLRTENNWSKNDLEFVKGNLLNLQQLLHNRQFDLCCMQRVLHYLTYQEAKEVLKYLRKIVNGKLYISVSGLSTYFNEYYEDKNKPVTNRFCHLAQEGAKKFKISNPICLYTKNELEILLTDSSWQIEKCWVSAFGNVKAVCY